MLVRSDPLLVQYKSSLLKGLADEELSPTEPIRRQGKQWIMKGPATGTNTIIVSRLQLPHSLLQIV